VQRGLFINLKNYKMKTIIIIYLIGYIVSYLLFKHLRNKEDANTWKYVFFTITGSFCSWLTVILIPIVLNYMNKFAVIILVIILIAIQHLSNWIIRKILNNIHSDAKLVFWTLVFNFLLSFPCVYYIIKWGYPLIQ
jgi:hypothetical protein